MGKKQSFEDYTISGDFSALFPLPNQLNAVQVHKKLMPKGASPAKLPAQALKNVVGGSTLSLDTPGLRVLHLDPLVLSVDNFFSAEECDAYLELNSDSTATYELTQSATFSMATSNARTSTTWFVSYQRATALLAKAMALLGKPLAHFEEPQLVRYRPGEQFKWHYDAVPATMLHNGGQRLATVLVYLNDVAEGGCTTFRDLRGGGTDADGKSLRLAVTPKKGRSLIFFPSTSDGVADERTLHAGQPAKQEKWVAQLWLHEGPYKPSVPTGSSQLEGRTLADAYARDNGLRVVSE